MNPQEFCREKGYMSTLLLTYDFDPLFFERVGLRNLWLGDTGDIIVLADARRLSECSSRWPGQLRNLGRRYQLLPAATTGAFHPKVILRVGENGGAVWLGSGNVTFGGWGGNKELGVAWAFGPGNKDTGTWLAAMLERYSSWCPSGLQHDVLRRMRDTPWVQSSAADNRGGSDPLLTSYGGSSLSSQLRLRWAGRRFSEAWMATGSTDENGALLRWLHGEFGVRQARVIVDQNRSEFLAGKIAALPLEAEVMQHPDPRTLHAKFLWLNGPDGPAAIVGSANCSAAAWLLAPDAGGNIEAVVVYDRARPAQFSSVLDLFHSGELTSVRLKTSKSPVKKKTASASTGTILGEIVWEVSSGEVRVRFGRVERAIIAVTLKVDGTTVSMHAVEPTGIIWVAEVPELFAKPESVFVDFEVQFSDGAISRIRGWVNDLTELRHASRGRRVAETLLSLARVQTTTEQQRVVTSLQRIGLALLSEPEAFPDPLSTTDKASKSRPAENGTHPENINPDDFVRSIDEVHPSQTITPGQRPHHSVSLFGVMRALFGAEESQGPEDGIEADPVKSSGGSPTKKPRPRVKPQVPETELPRPEERYINRLHNHMDMFLERLSSDDFSEQCTATQLVQAAAYPIAVATLGLRGGWTDKDAAGGWIRQVCDALFNIKLKHTGLLATVSARYVEQGRITDFERVVGDGTLWLALLSSLGSLMRKDDNTGLEKALALRAVYTSRDLIASGSAGRMGALLGQIDEERAQTVLRGAPEVVKLLDKLESYLLRHWDELMSAQETARPLYEVGDLLWHPKPGWSEVCEETQWGYVMDAYLHMRAYTTRVSSKFYLNVTKAVEHDGKLAMNLENVCGSS